MIQLWVDKMQSIELGWENVNIIQRLFSFLSPWEKIDHVNEAITAEKVTEFFFVFSCTNLFEKAEDGKCFMEVGRKNAIALWIPFGKAASHVFCNEWNSELYIISARELAFI